MPPARYAMLLLLASLAASAQDTQVPPHGGPAETGTVQAPQRPEGSEVPPVLFNGGLQKTDTAGPDVVEAARLLDDVSCEDGETLAKVEGLLDNAITQAHPKVNVVALVEKARYTLIVGSNCTSKVDGQALISARDDLELALLSDPNSTAALMQIAQVYTQMGRFDDALKQLKKAETLGERSALLNVYRGLAYIAMNNLQAAEEALRQVPTCRADQNRRAQCGARLGTRAKIDLYELQNNKSAAVRAHREAIAAFPTSAFMHGNLASYLVYKVGDLDGALAEADKALTLRSYGQVRTTQAVARYAKWAQLRRTDPAAAAQLRQQAQAVLSADTLLPRVACGIGSNPATQGLATALLEEGISIDGYDDRFTALMMAASCGESADVSWLLAKGASPQLVNPDGYTALALAAHAGDLDNVEALLPSTVLNKADNDGNTPLLHAIHQGHPAVALRLVQAKADVNGVDAYGDTALIRAAQGGYVALVKALLAAGADTAPQSRNVPLDAAGWAEKMGRKDLAEMIQAR